ncbi:hypothetical protein [Burkholderia vietnamiensis]|uniref:Uncharacterized protein n=1 Tax=Burkholderia vietnamiensis TaxID=60552 RepID=A0AAW7T5G6_BURVI|nr:hypothetical protein [Burkholderia vietnamiensis]MDN7797263.1 hypothetical protein [Burkholderia vietnamiensis]HDR9192140.1 hypothetical protein [Burkholderia vietnamiensis]
MPKKNTMEIAKPNVAAALEAIRSKKSREQVKIERLLPFVPVIDEALKSNWKWSPIIALIRQSGGPSLSTKVAQLLYEQIKAQHSPGDNDEGREGAPPSMNPPPHRPPFGPKTGVTT